MRVDDSFEVGGMTVLKLTEDLPVSGWRLLVIDGSTYKPLPVMDAGWDTIAIEGSHELDGKTVLLA